MKQLILMTALTIASSAFADHHNHKKYHDHKEHAHTKHAPTKHAHDKQAKKHKDHHHSKRSHAAHAHGQAKVDIVHEGKNLFIKGVFTGFDVFGFAQKPKNEKDKKTYLTRMTSLKTKVAEYFALPKTNKCTFKSSPEMEYEGGHSELNWNIIIKCKKTPMTLDANLIKMLPNLKKIKYSVIPYKAQNAYGKSSSAQTEKLNI